ncbi:uncharacterized protein LOC133182173 [Saccostrea echinata]|uniref:uncharacterized protein LOC133182173 n=1 Tax=Saccostrea echinata TaxID=191078 RepID=UPI002A83FE04|nr:uncharacterized protein LOC133182173 [Saccostrea echinata]
MKEDIKAFVRGFDDNTWKEEIEKRLSLVEESNVRLLKENEDLWRENGQLKQDLKVLRESVDKCGTLRNKEIVKELSEHTVEDKETLFERSTIQNHEEMPSGRVQPVARIIHPDTYPVSAVAFYGYLSQKSAPNLPAHHLIIYDAVHINRGNGYNKGDGIFIAPVTGVYVFHFSLCITEGENYPWASLEIAVNGIALGSTYEEGLKPGEPGGYHCSSNLVISEVNSGDHVFIRTTSATRGAIISAAYGRTSFSGWLL